MMKQKRNVTLLFGGVSSEHAISRISAASILEHIDKDTNRVRAIGITKTGRWLLTDPQPEEIRSGRWEVCPGNRPVMISLDTDTANRGLLVQSDAGWEPLPTDVIFPVLHGKNGEDGTVQGLLHMAEIPYVGSGTYSSAACMDKGITKALVSQAEAAEQAKCCIIHRSGCDPAEAAEGADAFFGGMYPLFVKPARSGSSVGISKVGNREGLEPAIRKAFAEDSKVLVEEAISGRELEVAVLGNDDPAVSCIGEIFSAGEFYDYNSKYEDQNSRTGIVTDLSPEKEQEIRDTALRVYRILECRGLARVDFFLQEDGGVIFNEVNTMPGFTQISMYPSLWEASGLSYSALIERLISLALTEEN